MADLAVFALVKSKTVNPAPASALMMPWVPGIVDIPKGKRPLGGVDFVKVFDKTPDLLTVKVAIYP